MISPFRIDGIGRISVGEKSFFQRGLWLYCEDGNAAESGLSVGKECVFGYNNHISCARSIVIGDRVLTANNVFISDNIHEFEDTEVPIIDQPIAFKAAVVIGSGSWIGENACIIGASVGKNSVVGANSVVTKDVPDYSVAVGSPARIIKRYDEASHTWIRCDEKPGQR